MTCCLDEIAKLYFTTLSGVASRKCRSDGTWAPGESILIECVSKAFQDFQMEVTCNMGCFSIHVYTPAHPYTHVQMQTSAHIRSIHTHVHMHLHIHMHTHANGHTHARTQRTHAHTHAHTQAHMYTIYRHMHIYTSMHSYVHSFDYHIKLYCTSFRVMKY